MPLADVLPLSYLSVLPRQHFFSLEPQDAVVFAHLSNVSENGIVIRLILTVSSY